MESGRGRSILVLCTGNSARSQIAAAYLAKYAGDRFDVLSAGTEPAADVHPMAVEVMREQGFELSGRPTDYRDYLGKVAPYFLITVCDGAAKSCPAVWPGSMERLHWPFDDPATATGTDAQKLARFREIRDEIHLKIRSWLVTVPGGIHESA